MEEMAARDKNIEQIINGGRAEKEKKKCADVILPVFLSFDAAFLTT
jgi:hypothetical protein